MSGGTDTTAADTAAASDTPPLHGLANALARATPQALQAYSAIGDASTGLSTTALMA